MLQMGDDTALNSTLLANSPQLLMSFAYLVYNDILTRISLASEWASYGKKRKGVRVSSSPESLQRSAYFLQFPYRFGIPLVVVSEVMHWPISQSIYLVKIEVEYSPAVMHDMHVNQILQIIRTSDILTLGWSPLGVILVLIGAVLMLAFLLGCGFIQFETSMPVVASCSATISAGCHPSRREKEPWLKMLQWGVTEEGHCSFSSLPVEYPTKGKIYM